MTTSEFIEHYNQEHARNLQTVASRSTTHVDDPEAEQLAWLMDSSISIGRFSIGLDALVGLIPGLGDLLTQHDGLLDRGARDAGRRSSCRDPANGC